MTITRIGTLAGLLLLTGTLTAQTRGGRGCCGGNGWRQNTAAQRQNTERRTADTCPYYGRTPRQETATADSRENYCPRVDSCYRQEQCAARKGTPCPAGYDCREGYCRPDSRTAETRQTDRRGYRVHRYGCDERHHRACGRDVVVVRRGAQPCATACGYPNGR